MSSPDKAREENNVTLLPEAIYQKIISDLKSIKYGSLTIVVQDGKIVQIDKNEKQRLR